MVEIAQQPIPEVAPGEVFRWGGRTLEAEAARDYSQQGYVLCELKLPVQAMGSPVPPGTSILRPPGT